MVIFSGVGRRYGDKWAARDLSFSVESGQVLGLLGQNGAGKTTALNLMTGYLTPSEGRVTVNGHDMQREPRLARQELGYLPEVPPLYDEMTVAASLRFACALKRVVRGEVEGHVRRVAAQCGVEDVLARRVGNLSKGYRQRVGLAQALCGDPPVLVLDEPTSGLDPRQRVEFRQTLRRLAGGRTVVFSSHVLSEVQALCDRVLILHHGRIVCDSSLRALGGEGGRRLKAEILSRDEALLPALRSLPSAMRVTRCAGPEDRLCVTLECKPGAQTERELFTLLSGLGAPLARLQEAGDTLEETFLRCTAEE